ncbi:MAG: M23 family metallopeptidase [Actinomycetota bacterium]
MAALLAPVVVVSPSRAAGAPPRAAWQVRPAYWRPVVVDGKTFPVARSNVFSLLEFTNNWHAVRLRLIDGKWKPVGVHEGIDITAEEGTPILSMTDGTVENIGWLFYSGMRVGVRGSDGRYYFYCHLSAIAQGLREGDPVRAGEIIGRVGNTGYGPPGHRDEFPAHLHFGIQAGSGWVNPYPTLASLYDAATVRAARDHAALDRLIASGARMAWERRAARAFTTFEG